MKAVNILPLAIMHSVAVSFCLPLKMRKPREQGAIPCLQVLPERGNRELIDKEPSAQTCVSKAEDEGQQKFIMIKIVHGRMLCHKWVNLGVTPLHAL